jgi:hypothetical protein
VKVLVTTTAFNLYQRLSPFYDTLRKIYGYEIIYLPIEEVTSTTLNNVDICLYDYFDMSHSRDAHNSMVIGANSKKEIFFNFKGKLYFFITDDGNASYIQGLDEEIFDRLDGWLCLMKRSDTDVFYNKKYNHKYCLMPRYVIRVNEPRLSYLSKQNNLFFYGRTSGANSFNGKNKRVESLKIIQKNKCLSEHFSGGTIDDTILELGNNQNEEYNKTIPYVHKDQWLTFDEFLKKINENRLSLCIPGNSNLGIRNYATLGVGSTMISTNLLKDPVDWFFSEKLKDCFYEIKDDLSDLEYIYEYALTHEIESEKIADRGYHIFMKYFQLEIDNTYNSIVLNHLKEDLKKINFPI